MTRLYYIDDWAMKAICGDDDADAKLLEAMQGAAAERIGKVMDGTEYYDEIMELVPDCMDDCLRRYRDQVIKAATFPLGWTFRESFLMRFEANAYGYVSQRRAGSTT